VNDTFERLKVVVAEKLGADPKTLTPDTRFQEDLEADSLDLVELIMALEDEYGLHISDEDAQKIRSMRDAVEYIETHVKK